MKVRAIRGVCIGPERHLAPGQSADVDPALSKYLVGIGAVELMPDEPAKTVKPPHEQPKPAAKADAKE